MRVIVIHAIHHQVASYPGGASEGWLVLVETPGRAVRFEAPPANVEGEEYTARNHPQY